MSQSQRVADYIQAYPVAKILNKTAPLSISLQDETDCFAALANLTIPDGILTGLGLSISGPNVLVAPGTWKIDGLNYGTLITTSIPFDPQDATYSRYDVLYVDDNNQINLVSGSLSLTPFEPAIPDGTIKIGSVLITPTQVTLNNPVPTDYVNTTGNQDVGGLKNFMDGIQSVTMPLGDNSVNVATTSWVQGELDSTAYWFTEGTFVGSGTELDPWSINVANVRPDGIISGLGSSISGSNVVIASGSWSINGMVYTTGTTHTLALDAQDITLSRYDSVFVNSASTFSIVSGTLSATPTQPSTPTGNIRIADVLITPTSVTAFESQISNYVTTNTDQTVSGNKTFIAGNTTIFQTTSLYNPIISVHGDVNSLGLQMFNQTPISFTSDANLSHTWFLNYDSSFGGLAFTKSGQPAITLKDGGIIERNIDSAVVLWSTDPIGSGSVTSVSGVADNGFTWSIADASTTPAITLTLQNASTSQAGQLTSADWNTFNSKQAALSGTGFVKSTGGTISYDTNTYLTTSTATSTYMPFSGGNFTGNINLVGDATTALQPVSYGQFLNWNNGFSWKHSVIATTTTTLPAYSTSGSFLVLTATSNGAFPTIDGVAIPAGENVLVKNESGSLRTNNGGYTLTDAGSVSTPWVLTRMTDSSSSAQLQSATYKVREGSTQSFQVYTVNVDPVTLGTTQITFALTGGAGTYLADGVSLTLTGNTFSLNNTYTQGLFSGTSPIQYSTGVISILTASGSQAGALSSADWTTFNNKVSTTRTVAGFALSSDITLANLTPLDSTLSFSATYNGSAAATIGLNLGQSNIWTVPQTIQSTTANQLTLNYDGTHGAVFNISSAGQLTVTTTNSLVQFPRIATTGIRNSTSSNNSNISMNTTGTVIDRTVADANSVLTINQANASSTGDIVDFQFNGSNVATVSKTGQINAPIFSSTVNNSASTTSAGLELINTNLATSGNQMYSPYLHLSSAGWGTTGSASQTVEWRVYATPTQGTNASPGISFDSQVAGGGWVQRISISSGSITGQSFIANFGNIITASTSDAYYANNSTAATSGVPNQYSPNIHLRGQVWNTTATAANNWTDWIEQIQTTSGTTPTSKWVWSSSLTTTTTPSYTQRMSLDNSGNLTVTATTISLGGFNSGTGVGIGSSNNFYANGGASATSTSNANALFAGASEVFYRTGFYGSTSTQINPNDSYASVLFAATPVTTGSSGTSAILAGLAIKAISPTITGGSAVTSTASLYIEGQASGATNNFGLLLKSANLGFAGSTSGFISIVPQAAAGTYNFNLPITVGTAGQALTSQGGGATAMTWSSLLSKPHNISTPTTGGTVNLTNNQYNIINPAGTLVALTINLPSSPSNNDCVFIKYTQAITTVTYGNGTVVDGITAPSAGGLVILVYDSGTTSWY